MPSLKRTIRKSKEKSPAKAKSINKTKGKSIKPKAKSPAKTKKTLRVKSIKKKTNRNKRYTMRKLLYKYEEYPYYENKSELVDKDLRNQVIHGANMKDMNLSGAKLQGTKFVNCVFNNTNFDGAHVDTHTEFIDCTFKKLRMDNIKYVDGAIKEDFQKVFELNKVSYI